MRLSSQKTIARPVVLSGAGLHSGVDVAITIKPARADAGIFFTRTDCRGENTVPAKPHQVADTRLGTRLQNAAGVSVATVEHLMAAFAICGVDNAAIDINGPELPIVDGSAAPFVEIIVGAGLLTQSSVRDSIQLNAPLELSDGDRFIAIEPSDERMLEVSIDFADEAIGSQALLLDLDDDRSLQRLASARTFCRLKDVETMRAAGLSLGGSLNNAIVVDGGRVVNSGALRDPEEFVLHKALDLIGDLYLLGAPIAGRIRARKPGHDLNTRFARMIAQAAESAAVGRSAGRVRLSA